MNKPFVYRVLGGAAFYCEGMGLLFKWINWGYKFSKAEAVHYLTGSVFHFFIWAGIILLWRADANEKPDKSSLWLKVLIVYSVLAVIGFIWGCYRFSKATWD